MKFLYGLMIFHVIRLMALAPWSVIVALIFVQKSKNSESFWKSQFHQEATTKNQEVLEGADCLSAPNFQKSRVGNFYRLERPFFRACLERIRQKATLFALLDSKVQKSGNPISGDPGPLGRPQWELGFPKHRVGLSTGLPLVGRAVTWWNAKAWLAV